MKDPTKAQAQNFPTISRSLSKGVMTKQKLEMAQLAELQIGRLNMSLTSYGAIL